MINPRKSNSNLDDQLADFTDRILGGSKGKQDEATFAPDPDLRALEKTALRLINSFDQKDPDEATIQRMQTKILEKWKLEKASPRIPFWQVWLQAIKPSPSKWQSQRSRQRVSLAFFVSTLVLIIVISIPYWSTTGSSQPGASGQGQSGFILIPTIGIILFVLWLFRRKS